MEDSSQSPIPELTLLETAKHLGIDRKTVKALLLQGVLRYRIAGTPDSKRPRYRIPVEDIMLYRNGYRSFPRRQGSNPPRKATKQQGSGGLTHIQID